MQVALSIYFIILLTINYFITFERKSENLLAFTFLGSRFHGLRIIQWSLIGLSLCTFFVTIISLPLLESSVGGKECLNFLWKFAVGATKYNCGKNRFTI